MSPKNADPAAAAAAMDKSLEAAVPYSQRWRTVNAWTHPILSLMARFNGTLPAPDGVTSTNIEEGAARIRLHVPDKLSCPAPGSAILHIHGGGMIMGSPEANDINAGGMARALGIPVIAARYRLAPTSKHPSALDDCAAAWAWLQANAAKLGIDPRRVAVTGDSAGGLLTAALCQRLRDEGGVQPAAQVLNAPMLDDRTAVREDFTGIKHAVWNNSSNYYGWASHLGQEPGLPTAPKYGVPARCEDLRGLPPTWIGVGSADIFHDEDVEYGRRLKEAGVEVEEVIVPGAFHGFEFAGRHPLVQQFNSAKRAYFRKKLGIPDRAKL
ncbi:Alpha/beta hydrolase fold-3 domain protein [Hyaloraphidium curvatum]|nr:Alpha/beta hydrolase fold-3 domain protein [Hyaloraphidium curvatum]